MNTKNTQPVWTRVGAPFAVRMGLVRFAKNGKLPKGMTRGDLFAWAAFYARHLSA